jgi:hypothetical protein
MVKRTAMVLAVVASLDAVTFACLAGVRLFAYMSELQAEHFRTSIYQQS